MTTENGKTPDITDSDQPDIADVAHQMLSTFVRTDDGYRARVGQVQIGKWQEQLDQAMATDLSTEVLTAVMLLHGEVHECLRILQDQEKLLAPFRAQVEAAQRSPAAAVAAARRLRKTARAGM